MSTIDITPHTYDGTIKWDAVLVCRKGKVVQIGGAPVISNENVERALNEALSHYNALSRKKRIGFKEQDFTNLVRALIVSNSSLGVVTSESRLMSDILKTIPTTPSEMMVRNETGGGHQAFTRFSLH